jgi:filamentous hemagglutinin
VNVGSALSFDGKLAPSGTGVGMGKDSGSASSTTSSGISGIAGNKDVRTGDAANGIQKIFDAAKVQNEINAQTQITQMFGQQASKAIGDYATAKMKEAAELRKQADDPKTNPNERTALLKQAAEMEANWSEGGTLRTALHATVGGLTGGVNGALGAGTSALLVPEIAKAVAKADAPEAVKQALIAAAGTAVGAAMGGAAGASAALNQTANNYLTHAQVVERDQKLAKCKTPGECQAIRAEYALIDRTQDANALYFIALARNCTDPAQCAFAQNALATINKEISDAQIGGYVRPEIAGWLNKSGAALQEVDRKLAKAQCDDNTLCHSASTLAGLMVGAGTAAGAAKLAAYCASPAGIGACASVATEALEALNALYNPVRVGVSVAAAAGAADRVAKGSAAVDGEMAGQYGSRVTLQKQSTQELLALENETNAHYLAKHGDQVTIQQLESRANTGIAPDGTKGAKVDSTRWLNNDDMLTAVRDAQQKLASGEFQLSPDGATRIVTIKFPNPIGDGVLKGKTAQTGYFQTDTAVVRFPASGSNPYTAYPIK